MARVCQGLAQFRAATARRPQVGILPGGEQHHGCRQRPGTQQQPELDGGEARPRVRHPQQGDREEVGRHAAGALPEERAGRPGRGLCWVAGLSSLCSTERVVAAHAHTENEAARCDDTPHSVGRAPGEQCRPKRADHGEAVGDDQRPAHP